MKLFKNGNKDQSLYLEFFCIDPCRFKDWTLTSSFPKNKDHTLCQRSDPYKIKISVIHFKSSLSGFFILLNSGLSVVQNKNKLQAHLEANCIAY